MIRGKTKEEYVKWLDESSNRELLDSLVVDATDFQKLINSAHSVVTNKISTNPNLDKEYRLQKIIRNYEKFGNVVVGVDFDFTLVDAVTHEIYQDIVQILKRGQRKEITYCIWTANDDEEYVTSKWYEAALSFQYYNQSPINPGAVKPHFNILLDDSAGLKEALALFVEFLDYLDSLDYL